MTFDGDNFGRGDLGDSSDRASIGSDYDPVIAEQFALLDRLKVPDYGARADLLPTAVALPAQKPRFDPSYALAVAAAFVVIAAASYFALRPTTDLGLDATNDGTNGQTTNENPNQSAAVQDGDGDGDKLTIEVAPSSTASSQVGAASEEQGSSDGESNQAGTDDETTTTTTTAPVESETTVTAPDSASSSTTAAGQDDDSPSTTIDKDSVLSTPTTKPGVTDPSLDVPVTSFPADGPDQMIVIRGILSELFTDCQAHYLLGAGGVVEQRDSITCDGGSYVVVDGKTIKTSAGLVPAGQYYNRHNPALRPGQQVVVSATAASQTSAALTLNCAQCGITLGG